MTTILCYLAAGWYYKHSYHRKKIEAARTINIQNISNILIPVCPRTCNVRLFQMLMRNKLPSIHPKDSWGHFIYVFRTTILPWRKLLSRAIIITHAVCTLRLSVPTESASPTAPLFQEEEKKNLYYPHSHSSANGIPRSSCFLPFSRSLFQIKCTCCTKL